MPRASTIYILVALLFVISIPFTEDVRQTVIRIGCALWFHNAFLTEELKERKK